VWIGGRCDSVIPAKDKRGGKDKNKVNGGAENRAGLKARPYDG